MAVKFAHEDIEIHLTGIPPHVMNFINHQKLWDKVTELHTIHMSKIEAACKEEVHAMRDDLDSRSIGGGQVRANQFEAMLEPINTRIRELAERLSTHSVSPTESIMNETDGTTSVPLQSNRYMRYQWGQDNKWRRLPENYTFNHKMTPLVAWQLWHHGDSDAPPLKFIDQLDICDSDQIQKVRCDQKEPQKFIC